ncbi:unnamed protein product [Pylaiella littoralis]
MLSIFIAAGYITNSSQFLQATLLSHILHGCMKLAELAFPVVFRLLLIFLSATAFTPSVPQYPGHPHQHQGQHQHQHSSPALHLRPTVGGGRSGAFPAPGGSCSTERGKARAATMLGAWRCSGSSNAELVKNLIDSSLVRSPRVAKAMQNTDRGWYTPQEAYEDRPQPIGFRATISAPHMHAHALEVLSPVIPTEGGRVLDVGCGSGFLTAALSRLVGVGGVVYGMDYIPELVGLSKANLEKDDESMLTSGRVLLKTGDGWKGWAENGPYDAIHVGAAAASIPIDLVSQLKVGGRMVVPVGPPSESQILVQVDRVKDSGPISESYTTENLMSVVYVPLVNTK